MRTIKVTGTGRLKLRPDTTVISLTLEGTYPEYGEALRSSSRDAENIKNLLTDFGFERSDLKTLEFSVDAEYESYREDDVYKQRFVGYKYRHVMKVSFKSDNERLGRVLYALARCPEKPELRLSSTVGDPEAVRNELLGKAVEDAAAKASVLTRAAGVTLGEIVSMDHSAAQLELEVRPVNRLLAAEKSFGALASSGSFDLNVEPDDINVSDTVTVIWEIG